MKLISFISFFLFISCSSIDTIGKKIGLTAPPHNKNEFHPLWFKNNDPDHATGNLPIATNWPTVYKGILYVGDNRGSLVAYELENGREVWREFDGGSYSSSPVIFKDQVVYGTTQGRLFSRNRLDGKIKYKIDLGSSVETQGTVNKGIVFFQLRDHKLVALDIETGKIIWAYKRSVPYLTTVQRASKPLVYKNKVYIGFADGFFCSFRMEDGVLLWERKISEGTKFVDVDLSPILYKQNLLVGSLAGPLLEINPDSGSVIRRFPYMASRSPLLYKDLIIIGSNNGEVVFLDKDLKEISKVKVSDLPISSIKSWKDYFAVSTVTKKVTLIRKSDFKIQQAFSLGHVMSAVFGELEVSNGVLSFLSSRNRLYVFR